ncbi:MAG: hypothetical protein GDA48_26565 [Hormoscilla sp. GM102CHS1]|nr:hypothetical protein [Hormoscilla sp. GM102CHS1]
MLTEFVVSTLVLTGLVVSTKVLTEFVVSTLVLILTGGRASRSLSLPETGNEGYNTSG